MNKEERNLFSVIKRTRKKVSKLEDQIRGFEESIERMEAILALKTCPFKLGDVVEGGAHTRYQGFVNRIEFCEYKGKPSYTLQLLGVRSVRNTLSGKKRLNRERMWPQTLRGWASNIELIKAAP